MHCAILLFAGGAVIAQHSSGVQPAAPLGLFRISETPKSGDAAPVRSTKFSIDDLSTTPAPGVRKGRRNDADYLALDAGKEYSRPLRGIARERTFVSFQVYGSQTTVIDIGGARLGLTAGPIDGSLQLMFDDSTTGTLQWKSLNVHIGTGRYDGKALAALPALTVALDPAAGYWHLYSGPRLLADHLPLIAAKRDHRRMTVKAGTEGAWIAGLVLSDENPLYEDTNANGIDDAFERQQRGALLPATASLAERQQLAQEWREDQRAHPPHALFINRPMPDRPVAATVSAPK